MSTENIKIPTFPDVDKFDMKKLVSEIKATFKDINKDDYNITKDDVDILKNISISLEHSYEKREHSLLSNIKRTIQESNIFKTLNFYNINKDPEFEVPKREGGDYSLLQALKTEISTINTTLKEIAVSQEKTLTSVITEIKKQTFTFDSDKKKAKSKSKGNSTFNYFRRFTDDIKDKFSTIINYPKNMFLDIKDSVTDKFRSILEWPKNLFRRDKSDSKKGGFSSKDPSSGILEVVKKIEKLLIEQNKFNDAERKKNLRNTKTKKEDSSIFSTILGFGSMFFASMLGKIKAIGTFFTKGFDFIANKLRFITKPLKAVFGRITEVGGSVGKFFVDKFKSVTSIISNIIGRFTGFFSSIGNFISKGFSGAIGTISKFAGSFGEMFTGIFQRIGNIFKPLGSILSSSAGIFKSVGNFTKAIPGLGWLITGITSIFSFVTGFMNTKGNLFEKVVGGFKTFISDLQDVFVGIPLKILDWVSSKIAGLFNIDLAPGWSDGALKWIKNLTGNIIDWVFTPFKDLYNLIFGDKKEESTNKESKDLVTKFTDLFSNIGSYLTNWLKKNPAIKGASWMWEKLTGSPLFDDKKEKQEVDIPKTNNAIIELPKEDKTKQAFTAIDLAKKNATDKQQLRTEGNDAVMKEVSKQMGELSDKLGKGFDTVASSTSAAVQNIYASSINTTNNENKNNVNIPEGIEALGLKLKNSSWGF